MNFERSAKKKLNVDKRILVFLCKEKIVHDLIVKKKY